jgi:fructoselysine-6-P-deglycase FrlB-like protein
VKQRTGATLEPPHLIQHALRFKLELDRLPSIYSWSAAAPVEALAESLDGICDLPLLAVGSGGSQAAALHAAHLHRRGGAMGLALTPLGFFSIGPSVRSSAVILATAGGRNPDILASLEAAARAEATSILSVCMAVNTPLALASREYEFCRVAEFDLPGGRDGFLAINSLLASCVLLSRAYGMVYGLRPKLPSSLPSLAGTGAQLNGATVEALSRENMVVLHGEWSAAPAWDLESKFAEAAIGACLVADYRNFAHGRHNWLQKRSEQTTVIAFETPHDRELVERTLDLIPKSVPVVRIRTKLAEDAGTIDLLGQVFRLTLLAGDARGLDPARPRIGESGRKLYHLRLGTGDVNLGGASRNRPTPMPILRKLYANGSFFPSTRSLAEWRDAFDRFVKRLHRARFGAIVLDYDGTLCGTADRFSGLRQAISGQLREIVACGVNIGIATGRGKSVKEALRSALPASSWRRVVVGYYNGSDVAPLDEDTRPAITGSQDPALAEVEQVLSRSSRLNLVSNVTSRPRQLTIEPTRHSHRAEVRAILEDTLGKMPGARVRLQEATVSFDLLAEGVTKLSVLQECARIAAHEGREPAVLCVGDKGRWPGNDHDLLSSPFSLSVDAVSPDLDSCWNLAPPGVRGARATAFYLGRVTAKNGAFRVNFASIGAASHE